MSKTLILSTNQVAERLGVHVRTVNRMAEDGRLTPIGKMPGIRGARLFDADDVDQALARLDRCPTCGQARA